MMVRVTVYTYDIFCESNISHALHPSYFFNEFKHFDLDFIITIFI